jgi:DNA-binding transcriptional LysR family regulator
MAEIIAPSLPAFLARYGKVTLQMITVDRPVDLIAERIDVALRVRTALDSDAGLTMRRLGRSFRYLVAAPALAAGLRGDIGALERLPTLGSSNDAGEVTWELVGPEGEVRRVRHEPRLSCEDFAVLRRNAIGGVGVALIPDHLCQADLDAGRLVRVYPDWHGVEGIVHLVFTTRRGLPPAVRVFIDHLANVFRAAA